MKSSIRPTCRKPLCMNLVKILLRIKGVNPIYDYLCEDHAFQRDHAIIRGDTNRWWESLIQKERQN